MYTRCPSCRAEISFEPPANAASLPDGYKHRIKCPSCGVTIGVKIPHIDTSAQLQPTYTPANPNATAFQPVYQAGPAVVGAAASVAKVKPSKKSGAGRNVFMLIFSLLFVALSICGYLASPAIGIIPIVEGFEWVTSLSAFDGITPWATLVTDFDGMKALFELDAIYGILYLIPMILFTLAAINLLGSIIALCCKKYGRAYNFIFSLLIGACACTILFIPFIIAGLEPSMLGDYFIQGIIGNQQYFLIVGAALGLLQFIFSMFFFKSLKRKNVAL